MYTNCRSELNSDYNNFLAYYNEYYKIITKKLRIINNKFSYMILYKKKIGDSIFLEIYTNKTF